MNKLKKITAAVKKYIGSLDKLLLFAVCLCTIVGITLIYSLAANGTTTHNVYKTQVISMIIGLVVCIFISCFDYKDFAKLWYLYVPAALVPVLLTFTSMGVGVEGTDDVAWLRIGSMQFQPAEFLKIAFLLSFSYHLSRVSDDMNNLINIILLCIHAAVPIGLVMKQGDHGTALVFIMMFVVMMYSSGLSLLYIIPALLAVPVVVMIAWQYLLGSVQKERIMILFNPGSDPEGIEWQQDLGLSSLTAGNIFGNGLFGNEKSNVPEIYNDFIFSYVGYAFGFVGCIALIVVFAFICIKIIANALVARDCLGKNICMGAFAMLFTHCALNIGMVLKVMPVIGIPLPFLSSGGTALVSMYIVIGTVLSARQHNEKIYRMFA
ncbi:MAG: FtsW/RodA/SpoVE family cell cycle protein [Oscillospiraceae bacterium]|nr:FtsW/RodA/SpoVE family cell cycle protein [Oscillospiraceae bacterium]